MRKSRFLASPNHPKILPKCLRKRCPNKHVIFQRFWLEKTSVARAPTLDFCWQGHSFVSFSHYSMFHLLYAFSVQKNLPKTLPKRGPNPSKIDAENVLVFYIDFFTSWPRFWRLLGLQVGAKLAQNASPRFSRSSFEAFLS